MGAPGPLHTFVSCYHPLTHFITFTLPLYVTLHQLSTSSYANPFTIMQANTQSSQTFSLSSSQFGRCQSAAKVKVAIHQPCHSASQSIHQPASNIVSHPPWNSAIPPFCHAVDTVVNNPPHYLASQPLCQVVTKTFSHHHCLLASQPFN